MIQAPERSQILRLARQMLEHYSFEQVIDKFPEHKDWLKDALMAEINQAGSIVRTISKDKNKNKKWFLSKDRSTWHYWNSFRDYLFQHKGWSIDSVRALDKTSDAALGELRPPEGDSFDIRGLVVGYVQSGKTSHFTALLAKAADCGYRFFVVFSGIDMGLRRQTQLRLDRELTGANQDHASVERPPIGMVWHQFTNSEIDGDFKSASVNQAALQGSQPVLMVIKKNKAVLQSVIQWLESAPKEFLDTLPAVFVDDEADQASIDWKGTYRTQADFESLDNELTDEIDPTTINRLIRTILTKFKKKSYIAYTATPYANVLIPPDKHSPNLGDDLYPRDFIIPLPKPNGYYGAQEFFGSFESYEEHVMEGLSFLRSIDTKSDQDQVGNSAEIPRSLKTAIKVFILGGAIRAARGQDAEPCAMLIHLSHRKEEHGAMLQIVQSEVQYLMAQWHYDPGKSLHSEFENIFNLEYASTWQIANPSPFETPPFSSLVPKIAEFLYELQREGGVRVINSESGEILDYEIEPNLKVIAIGGNKLSRGLTLEGLLVSYFDRRSQQYDTLFQMGRWFGFIGKYYDLVRVYTKSEQAGWFRDLARIEYEFHEDLAIYARNLDLTPAAIRPRIALHKKLQPTSAPKRRFAVAVSSNPYFAGRKIQTTRFPISRELIDDLGIVQEKCRQAAIKLLNSLDRNSVKPHKKYRLVWQGVSANIVVDFLNEYEVSKSSTNFDRDRIVDYINRAAKQNELVSWTVAICGLANEDKILGKANWVPSSYGDVWNIARNKDGDNSDSIGTLTSSGDELIGLTYEQLEKISALVSSGEATGKEVASRSIRPKTEGLLMLYPISKRSGYGEAKAEKHKRPLFSEEDFERNIARDLIGIALSFPFNSSLNSVQDYLTVVTKEL